MQDTQIISQINEADVRYYINEQLFGCLVPCNPNADLLDLELKKSNPSCSIGRGNLNSIQLVGLTISAHLATSLLVIKLIPS
jgi:hypothetical protein